MKNEKPKPRGRPKGYRAEDPASEIIRVRVTEGQLSRYKAAAEKSGRKLSGWIRETLDDATKENPK